MINKIHYEIPDTNLLKLVKESESLALIKSGMAYKQEVLGGEREKLMRVIRNAGYYKFDRDAIEFEIDTLHKTLFRNLMNPFEGIVNVYNERKEWTGLKWISPIKIWNPEDSSLRYQQYTLDSIIAYPDYPSYGSTADSLFKTTQRRGLVIRYRQNILKPAVLYRSVLLKRMSAFPSSVPTMLSTTAMTWAPGSS